MHDLAIDHDGEIYRAVAEPRRGEHGQWTAEHDHIDLVLLRDPGSYPLIQRGRLRETPEGVSASEGLQWFIAVRHKFIGAAIQHDEETTDANT